MDNPFTETKTRRRKPHIIVTTTLMIALFIGSVIAIDFWQKTVHHSVSISEVYDGEVYSNPDLTVPLNSVDWGTLSPSSSQNQTIYVKSLSNVDTIFSIVVTDWNPSNAADYIHLTSNANNTIIPAKDVLVVILTLKVDSDAPPINALFDTIIKLQ